MSCVGRVVLRSILGAAATAMLSLSTAEIAQAQSAGASVFGRQITEIVVTGAQRIEEATIRSYLQLSEGDVAEPGAINEAFKRLFATGLFRDVTIEPQASGALLVTVAENPIINQIAFEGNRRIDEELLLAQVRSRTRTAFTRARAEADAQIVLDAYRAAGRYSATVEPVIIELSDNRVNLVFEINEGPVVGVSAINFVGNSEYSDRRLRRVVETEETAFWKILTSSDSYDPDRLEFDKELLRRFYFSRGYADFEVLSATAELNPERDGFFITFSVDEGEVYETGKVDLTASARGVDPALFADLVEPEEGDRYNANLVEDTIRAIQRRAGEQGVNFIDVRPRANKRKAEGGTPTIDLTFDIVEAPRVFVERIEIEGNVRTLDRVVRREFELVEGDAFNAFRLQQSRSNVRSLGFFGNVEVASERGSAEDRVVIRTKVEERSTGDISFGLGFSTSEKFGGQISITERNFLGRGQFVRASVSVTTERQFFDFSFSEPFFLGRNLKVGFDVFHREIDNQDESSFDTRETGLSPRVTFPLSDDSQISLNYLIEADQIRDVPDDASPLIEEDKGRRLISAVGYNYSLDLRNDKITPTRGLVARVGQSFSGAGGDAFYVKSTGSVKTFYSFLREDVITSLELAGGAIVGFNKDQPKVSDRFNLGGDTFRGFSRGGVGPRDTNIIQVDGTNETLDDALGGKYYAIARADVSFPLGLPEEFGINGGLFFDVGSLWGLDDNTYTATDGDGNANQSFSVDDAFAIRAAGGFSLFWTSPFGPLRLNFALPVIEQEEDDTEFFRFSAGTRF